MPSIPVFQQQRLASAAVGTPGVDPSAGRIAGTVAKVAGDLVSVAFKIEDKRQEALAGAEANRRLIEFKISHDDMEANTKSEFGESPQQGQVEFGNRSLELFNTSISASENTRANRKFSAAAQAFMGQRKIEFGNFRRNQEVIIAKDDLVIANNLSALQAQKIGETDHSPAGLQQTFDLIDASQLALDSATVVLGAKEAKNLAQLGPESIVRGYLDGLIKTNPEFALEVLNNPEVVKVFDNFEEVTQLEDDALAKIDDLDNEADKKLGKRQNQAHFRNMVSISDDPEKRADLDIRADVVTNVITPEQGLKEFNLKRKSSTRKSVESVRAEGTKLLALGELTNEWISDNAEFLSPAHVSSFSDALTVDVTKQPSYQAAIAQIDAEIEEISFGFRKPEDDKLFADAEEAVRRAVIVDNKNPFTAAQEQITIIKKIKANRAETSKINIKARALKRKMGGVVTPELIEKERIRVERKVSRRQISQDEALTIAEALEMLETEVQSAK